MFASSGEATAPCGVPTSVFRPFFSLPRTPPPSAISGSGAGSLRSAMRCSMNLTSHSVRQIIEGPHNTLPTTRTPARACHHHSGPHHPFVGRTLAIFGSTALPGGKVHLILILPNGSRSLIPAEVDRPPMRSCRVSLLPRQNPTRIFGSVSDLLHALAVVDALLQSPHSIARQRRQICR